MFLHGHCCISHRTWERNFHFNLLQRGIEIREIISDVNKKDTPRFAGKNFVSTDQRYRKIVACLLAKYVRSTPLRWYDTLKYGDAHEKFNFMKIEDLRPLNTCQKYFLTILSNFPLDECEI